MIDRPLITMGDSSLPVPSHSSILAVFNISSFPTILIGSCSSGLKMSGAPTCKGNMSEATRKIPKTITIDLLKFNTIHPPFFT
jgi:hypothetical protein